MKTCNLSGIVMLTALVTGGCSTVQTLTGLEEPALSFKDVTIERLSFDTADVIFDLEIYNPNRLNAKLDGFDYAFSIDERTLVKGTQEEEVYVPKQATSTIKVPVSLSYRDVYSTLQNVSGKDVFDYVMQVGMHFDVPLLGSTVIPVSYRGTLPVIRIPTLAVNSLKIERMNMTGADLLLQVDLENPNTFNLLLDNLHYTFTINDRNWAKGIVRDPLEIKDKDQTTVAIPITLDFLSMGSTVYNALKDRAPLEYEFEAVCDATSSLEIMKPVTLPLRRTGEIKILQ